MKNSVLSFGYIKHQQIFMNLFFNYSKLLAKASLYLPLSLCIWYDKIVTFLFHLEDKRNIL